MGVYLQEDRVCRRNALKHVTGDVLHIGVSGSIGDNVWEIQHAALHMRESLCDGLGSAAEPAGDVDEGANPLEDVAALLDHHVHDETAVRDHPVVEELAEAGVVVGQIPYICRPGANLKGDGSGNTCRNHSPRSKKEDTKTVPSIKVRNGVTFIPEPTRRRDAGVSP